MYYPQSEWQKKQGYSLVPLPDPQIYTTGDGTQIAYHGYRCNGPYSTPGSARGRISSMKKYQDDALIVYAEVESSTGTWNIHPQPVK